MPSFSCWLDEKRADGIPGPCRNIYRNPLSKFSAEALERTVLPRGPAKRRRDGRDNPARLPRLALGDFDASHDRQQARVLVTASRGRRPATAIPTASLRDPAPEREDSVAGYPLLLRGAAFDRPAVFAIGMSSADAGEADSTDTAIGARQRHAPKRATLVANAGTTGGRQREKSGFNRRR